MKNKQRAAEAAPNAKGKDSIILLFEQLSNREKRACRTQRVGEIIESIVKRGGEK